MTDAKEQFPSDEEVEAARLAGALGALVEDTLGVLVGEAWNSIGRAVDMEMLSFGKLVHAPSKRDPGRRAGEWALHVQCPLRIRDRTGPILGGADLYVQADDPHDTPSDFDFDANRGKTLWDRRAQALNDRLSQQPHHVLRIVGDRWGGFSIELTDDALIEAFPCDSYPTEAWRFFRMGDTSRHFVIPADKH